MKGEPGTRKPGPWALPRQAGVLLGLVVPLLAAPPARAESGDTTVSVETTVGKDFRAWSLLGDVELRDGATFLTLGYTGARPEAGTALTHQLSLGADQVLGDHWLLSGIISASLPKDTTVELVPKRPARRRRPSVDASTGSASQGALLSLAYDTAGLSDLELGADASLSLTRHPLRRELRVTSAQGNTTRFAHEDILWAARPGLGIRLLPGTHWEVGARGSLSLYSEDPLSAGQFTREEQAALVRRFRNAFATRRALRRYQARVNRDLGTVLARRMADANATAGIPTAPSRFDVRPSLTWKPGRDVRGQLSYAFTRYVAGEGWSHLLGTRWTVRLGAPLRVWASVALQEDHLEAVDPGETPSPVRSGLMTLGGEYTF
ncbi:hypothetical protein [Myxococcus qinghaiensis]|uniref:hypothetical protein n=1 Tax=Myxococcus qinghaiensis TaxID=2906758 RepID=UPI0020A71A67|nr:hypothetical protein [Myxococcus qinghaiensis]MCP3168632.1 hypothetical protein [Myxococcus qinghaiensis]